MGLQESLRRLEQDVLRMKGDSVQVVGAPCDHTAWHKQQQRGLAGHISRPACHAPLNTAALSAGVMLLALVSKLAIVRSAALHAGFHSAVHVLLRMQAKEAATTVGGMASRMSALEAESALMAGKVASLGSTLPVVASAVQVLERRLQARVDGACVAMGSLTEDMREVARIHAMDTKNPFKGEPWRPGELWRTLAGCEPAEQHRGLAQEQQHPSLPLVFAMQRPDT